MQKSPLSYGSMIMLKLVEFLYLILKTQKIGSVTRYGEGGRA